jgi:hypothetical protein
MSVPSAPGACGSDGAAVGPDFLTRDPAGVVGAEQGHHVSDVLRVEYDLTPLGRKFLEPVKALCGWALAYRADLRAALANREKERRT